MASGDVAVELCPDREPLEPQEAFLFDEHGGRTGSKVLRNEYLDSLVLDPLVSRHVGFPGVGVDRHRSVTASAQPGKVIERHRPVAPVQVLPCSVGYQELQIVSRQNLLLNSSSEHTGEQHFDAGRPPEDSLVMKLPNKYVVGRSRWTEGKVHAVLSDSDAGWSGAQEILNSIGSVDMIEIRFVGAM